MFYALQVQLRSSVVKRLSTFLSVYSVYSVVKLFSLIRQIREIHGSFSLSIQGQWRIGVRHSLWALRTLPLFHS